MSVISNFSKFYFIDSITSSNQNLDFDETSGEVTAVLVINDYAPNQLATEVTRAMNSAGALTWAVSFSNVTRKYTITNTTATVFSLLIASGSNLGTSVFTLLGFTGADLTGSDTYTGDTVAGTEFIPQFKVQNYRPSVDSRISIDGVENVSSSGNVTEVVRFGTRQTARMEFVFITDLAQPSNGPITSNLTGKQDTRDFMTHSTDKKPFEFMEDKDAPAVFETFILNSTAQSQNGTWFELIPMARLGGRYVRTGIMELRKVS